MLSPPTFGLKGIGFGTYSRDGHISFWNNYVAVLEIHPAAEPYETTFRAKQCQYYSVSWFCLKVWNPAHGSGRIVQLRPTTIDHGFVNPTKR